MVELTAINTGKMKLRNNNYYLFSMQVPAEYSFIGVVDIFFKIHKVFNLHFDKAVHQLMLFIEYFIFGIATAYDGMTTNTKKYGKQIFPNSR